VVADAGSYVGVTPLQKAAALGDFTIIAKTIMTQIVPSAQSETPIPATIPYAAAGFPVSAAEAVTFSTSQTWNTTTSLALPGGCLPGSLSIVVGGVTLTDKGGILMSGTQQIGLVDYANGIVTSSSGSYDGSKTISYRPAAYMQRMPQSSEIRITAENRSQSYTGFITPLPARGTLSFSYRAQGRWYVLSDSGDGALRGTDSSYGAGTYSAETGSFVVTLGALPDVGSSIVQHWGVPTQETVQPAADLLISQTIALACLRARRCIRALLISSGWMARPSARPRPPLPGSCRGCHGRGAGGPLRSAVCAQAAARRGHGARCHGRHGPCGRGQSAASIPQRPGPSGGLGRPGALVPLRSRWSGTR
jgi:hypothetical protein